MSKILSKLVNPKWTPERFFRLMEIKKYGDAYSDFGYNTYITWRGLDIFELAKTEKQAKIKLYNRICKWEKSFNNKSWKQCFPSNL